MSAPLPPNETERLEALRHYGILDSAPESQFDDLTQLAAQICGTPISAFTLVDQERQWFKSIVGLDVAETPRELSFCAHTILDSDVLLVPDAATDARFAQNVLVTAEPHLRFYAGVPLVSPEGFAIGALCVLDIVPRELSPAQQDALRRLGRHAIALLDARPDGPRERDQRRLDNQEVERLRHYRAVEAAKNASNINASNTNASNTNASNTNASNTNASNAKAADTGHPRHLTAGGDGFSVDHCLIIEATTGRIAKIDASLCALLGRASGEFLQASIWQDAAFARLAVHRDELRGLDGRSVFWSDEIALENREGHPIPVQFVGNAFQSGQHQWLQFHIREIGEPKREAERAAQSQPQSEREARFLQGTLDSLASHVAVLDETGRIVAVNRAWREFSTANGGTPATSGTGANYLQICDGAGRVSPEAQPLAEGLRRVMAGEQDRFCLQYPCHSPTEQRWFNVNVTRFEGAEQNAARVVVSHENISEQKQVEHLLAQTEREQRALAQQLEIERGRLEAAQRVAMVGSWETDLATRRVLWSPEIYRICELESELEAGVSLSHDDFLELVHPEDRERVARAFEESLSQNASHSIEHRLLLAGGRVKFVEEHWQIVRDAAGGAVEAVGTCQDITRRKAEESQLHFQRVLLEAQTQASLDSVLVVAHDQKILSYNRRFIEMWNLAPEVVASGDDNALRQAILKQCLHPEEVAARAVLLYAEPTQHTREEIPLLDGRILDRYSAPITDETGAYFGRVWFFRDITEAKTLENTLRAGEERFQSIVANVPGMVYQFVLEPDGSLAWPFVSQGSREIYEAEPEWIQTHPTYPVEVIHPDDRESFDRTVLESARTLSPWRWEGRHRVASGKTVWLHGLARPRRLPGGGTLWNGMVTDITARKEAETERDRFFTVSLDMLAVLGFDGHFKRLNPAFTETLGFTEAEFGAKPYLEWVHPDDHAASTQAFESVSQQGFQVHCENRYLARDGSYHWLEWKATAVVEEEVIYAAARDVTERKEAEASLLRLRDELEERVVERTAELGAANHEMSIAKAEADAANAAKSEFLSRMSHELRTPLNAILGFGQILEMADLAARQKTSVHHILKAGRHLLDLINEVLDIARVEAGHIELSLEPIAIADVVPEACALVASLAAGRGISVRFDPGAWQGRHVLADRQRFKQILINLLANAIKYNRENGAVEVTCTPEAGGWSAIAVRDTGAGIAPEDLPKLFMPFERLQAENSPIEGTGLGLVLSQRLAQAMGGTLGAQSQVGYGSTFILRLPEAISPQELLEMLPDQPGPLFQSAANRNCTVLCIEDNQSNLSLMEAIFGDHPEISLLTAMEGRVGLNMAREHRPDLILLDLNLPDIHGRDVLTELQQNALTADIPVIIVSADATPQQVERLLGAGAKAYLTKPLNVLEFLQTLNSFLPAAPGGNRAGTSGAIAE